MPDVVEKVLLVVGIVGLVGFMIGFVRVMAYGMVDNRTPTRRMYLTAFAFGAVGWGALLIGFFLP
ncbi:MULTISPECIES: hypothetical protein [Clavibacter]|uniref:Uncharacterized protein n=2 Tax=Clavibacter TaxID=1573 RepID=A0A399NPD2_9MICO|nr:MULTISPECIES: hypothetical protein [Clavibacter]KDP92582.1 hypothetical protein W824_01065 [Clavibacter cf. michiganensis LMG 26808]RII95731.1 hypothetical protein DZF96_14005 [Clavibacter michiganensis]UKF25264.1 hypothetical protein KYT88_00800 [Clavibacter sp. A6099]